MITEKLFNIHVYPYLKTSSRKNTCFYSLFEIFQCVLYRLKTGCQWREIPTKQFFSKEIPCWQTIWYHFNKWSEFLCLKKIWNNYLEKVKSYLDLNVINLDGSHTLSKRGGEKVFYQRRKKGKTTNMLYMTDRNGILIGCSDANPGNKHDSYEIISSLTEIWKSPVLNKFEYSIINTDSAFDNNNFRYFCKEYGLIHNIYRNPRNSNLEEEEMVREILLNLVVNLSLK